MYPAAAQSDGARHVHRWLQYACIDISSCGLSENLACASLVIFHSTCRAVV